MATKNTRRPIRKIALEEHFEAPGMARENYDGSIFARFSTQAVGKLRTLLQDFDDERIATLDECGIDLMVLSQTGPGVQVEKDTAKATRLAREANDFLSERIQRHRTRYAGFAHLALQDPRGAADELQRCVEELGFVGALINHHTNGQYLDRDTFSPFWERAAALGVPVYLHPADPYDSPHVYQGSRALYGPAWTWNCEISAHALRIALGGVFDHFPAAKLIIGHMGETIPFYLSRLDSRVPLVNAGLKRLPSQVLRAHLFITTSGVCSNHALRCSINELGIDNVLFSTDYPYEDARVAADWIETAPLTDEERTKVCYQNAQHVLKLALPSTSPRLS
jgi:2,3-dihydroxybenzoate decarboxylase